MKTFKELAPALDGHRHVALLDDEAMTGRASLGSNKQNHTHEIVWDPGQEEIPAQFGQFGEIVVPPEPAREPGWVCKPAPDGHTHEFADIQINIKSTDESDTERIAECYQLFRDASEIERDSIELATQSEEVYFGKQWDDDIVSKLEESGRAALTINLTQPKLDELSGHEREQRTDFRCLPVEKSDQKVCDILNQLLKIISENSSYALARSDVFLDAAVTGRGLFNVYISHEKDLRGDIIIEHFPWQDVRFGPHLKTDLSDCEHIHKHKMYSLQGLKRLFPDVEDQITLQFDQGVITDVSNTSDQSIFGASAFPWAIDTIQMVDHSRKLLRVVETWQKIYLPAWIIVSEKEDLYYNTLGWPSELRKLAKTIPDVQVFETSVTKLRVTKFCGTVMLSDEFPAELPTDDFYVVPVYAHKRGARFWGKVSQVIDAQQELNKRHSQAIDIGNKSISSGWFYDQGTFPDNEKEKFKRIGTSPGFTVEVNDISRLPQKSESGVIPPVIVDLMQLSEQRISQLLNVTVEPQGANDSGAKMLQMERQRLLGNEYLFDHLDFAEKKICRLIIGLIQRYYPPERIYRMLMSRNGKKPVMVGDQPIDEFTEDDIRLMLESADLTKVDIAIGQATYSPTVRLANFLLLSDLAGKGMPIPPDVLVELMDLPEELKNRVIEGIQAQGDAAAAAESAKGQAEIDKTLIGQGIIPPEVQQRLAQGGQGAQEPGQPIQAPGDGAVALEG